MTTIKCKDKGSRDDLVAHHMMLNLHLQGRTYFSFPAGLPNPYPPSVAPLQELKQLYLNDLRPNTHHRGGYLLLRAITPPLRKASVDSILEDEVGDAVLFQLYQQDEDIQPAVEVIPEGRVCIVKEPWYKTMTDGKHVLRADHLSDIMWLTKADGRMPLKWRPQTNKNNKTATQLKDKGNDALKMGKPLEAIEWYG